MKLFVLPVLLVSVAVAQNSADNLIDEGSKAFRQAEFPKAIALFKQAAELEPNSVKAHLNLAFAYLQQWVPGADSVENKSTATNAENSFQRVLQLDLANKDALMSLANLYFNQKRMDKAQEIYREITVKYPGEKLPHYTLGVIAWIKVFPVRMEARARVELKSEDPGPLPPSVRFEVSNRNLALVNEGISSLEKALVIDPRYDDAMAYMNMLYRERADLQETADGYSGDLALADHWVDLTLETKRSKLEAAMARSVTEMSEKKPPLRIRVHPNVQKSNLLFSPTPSYPESARKDRLEGTVQFAIVVDTKGRILESKPISGHPALIEAASLAILKTSYKPTILDGEPVEVETTIDFNFTLAP